MIARLELVAGVNHLPNGVIGKGVLPLSTVLLRGHSSPKAKKCAIINAACLHAVRGRAFIGRLEAHRIAHLRLGDHEVDRGDRHGLHVLEDIAEVRLIQSGNYPRFTRLSVYCSAEVCINGKTGFGPGIDKHHIVVVYVEGLVLIQECPVLGFCSVRVLVLGELLPGYRTRRHPVCGRAACKRRHIIRRLAGLRGGYRGGYGGDRHAICQRGRRNEAYYHDQAYDNAQ